MPEGTVTFVTALVGNSLEVVVSSMPGPGMSQEVPESPGILGKVPVPGAA